MNMCIPLVPNLSVNEHCKTFALSREPEILYIGHPSFNYNHLKFTVYIRVYILWVCMNV